MHLFKLTLLSALVALPLLPQGLPPLIDRELLFGNPEIAGAQLSPDGNFIAFQKPYKNTRNIWVKETNEPFSAARLLTQETKRPISGFFWSADSKYILFVKDNDGDENFNVFAVDPKGIPTFGFDAPIARDLTGLKGIQIQIYSVPKKDPDTIYIGLNDRDKAWHDLYRLKLSTGEKTLLRKNTDKIASWNFDEQGQLRLVMQVTNSGEQQILRVDPEAFTKIYSCDVFESCGPVRFHKDNKRVYLETNKGSRDLSELILFDPVTLKEESVESDPLKRVDFGQARFSDVTDELTLTIYNDEKVRRYFKDKTLEADYKLLQARFPGLEIGFGSHSRDEQVWLISTTGDTEPGATYLFDRKTKKTTLQYKLRDSIPRTSLSPMTPIRYKSSDGLEIPAYLTLPKGLSAKGLPVLVVPHGGPWARDSWGFNSMAQFFANRGYAVLSPNFRGSTGYGKKFLNAGNGEWGRKMQDDITWGVKHLIAQGTADPKRVGILGGSYGGYAVLAGVAFTPDLYRAGVDIVGPSNLITLLDAIPPYWEAGKKIMFSRMADPATPEGKAWLKARSPLNAADKIKTPLMVVQGANDPRVNKAEAEQIVVALRDHKSPVEYLLAPDEGHGFQRPVNNMAMFMAIEKFLAKQLDGRYQEGGTPEVEKRLQEITVDPKTVTLTKKADASEVKPATPTALTPGVYHYQGKLSFGGQQVAIKLTSTIQEEDGNWVATDLMETPMGKVSDAATLDKATLYVKKRNIQQGPANIEMIYDGNKVKGKIVINNEERPIDGDIGGPLFADAAGAQQSIGALPLAEGYTLVYRNFDLTGQKAKLLQLKVAGTEKVTVPAGSFDCYRVEVISAEGRPDKMTIWIAKDTRQPVKTTTVMPQMGGATMESELLPQR
ncbi:alpha/beta fold hydrolase [Bryobacter aggregatus]|uniref:S9 family peptidase n=1 Tax=Bryobacter aggregatus TaxID=360054 RepID=UPI0009B5A010|nr:alpha/beta fold hydrolase [Bryobacter aggregatus]